MLQILGDIGFAMSDETFSELCLRLSFHNGYMTYTDFVSNFDDPRMSSPTFLTKSSNHHMNEFRGENQLMTVDDVKRLMPDKLRQNFDVRTDMLIITFRLIC